MTYLGFDKPLGRLNLGFTESPSVFGAHVRPNSQVGGLLQGLQAIEKKKELISKLSFFFLQILLVDVGVFWRPGRPRTQAMHRLARLHKKKISTQLSDSALENTYHLLWGLENKSLREQTKRPLYWSFDDCREGAIRNAQHHLVSSLDVYQTLQPLPRTDLPRAWYTQETDLVWTGGSSSLRLCVEALLMKALHLIAVYLDKRWIE